jgi:hypothetical protein
MVMSVLSLFSQTMQCFGSLQSQFHALIIIKNTSARQKIFGQFMQKFRLWKCSEYYIFFKLIYCKQDTIKVFSVEHGQIEI